MRRTSTITVAGLAAAALTLSACGRDAAETPAGETGEAVATGAATGTITVWAMGAEGEKLPELAKEFESANPGAKVEVTAIPWDAAHDKFTTAITANKTPDVAMVGTTWMGEFAELGALDPTPGQIDKSMFFEGAQKTTMRSEMARERRVSASSSRPVNRAASSSCSGLGVVSSFPPTKMELAPARKHRACISALIVSRPADSRTMAFGQTIRATATVRTNSIG